MKKFNNINTTDTTGLIFKKTDFNTKIRSSWHQIILLQANLASKNDIADFVKKIDFDYFTDKLKI